MTTPAVKHDPVSSFRDSDPAIPLVDLSIVLPVQLLDGGRAAEQSGEKRLMAAVLADAIHVFLKHRGSPTAGGQILFRETGEWIESRDRSRLLCFESVCDVLGIAPDRLRRLLRGFATGAATPAIPIGAARLRVARGRKMRV